MKLPPAALQPNPHPPAACANRGEVVVPCIGQTTRGELMARKRFGNFVRSSKVGVYLATDITSHAANACPRPPGKHAMGLRPAGRVGDFCGMRFKIGQCLSKSLEVAPILSMFA